MKPHPQKVKKKRKADTKANGPGSVGRIVWTIAAFVRLIELFLDHNHWL